jgi:uncharacterized protein YaiE (UPF0345 family)
MFESISRRGFLGLLPTVALAEVGAPVVPFAFRARTAGQPAAAAPAAQPAAPAPGTSFPAQDPDLVRETVGVSHGNLARLKELVSARPALARASWDWGFGDWETAIDAASHVGNRPIAEYLIANGARPTIYTAAMMGHLAIVKGWIESAPGVQRNRGPHGITLLAHARNGGAGAAEVLKYLESLGDADPRYTDLPVGDADQAAIAGEYTFGTGATERFKVAKNARGILTIQRTGQSERNMVHQGALAFIPVGAEAVRIRFDVVDGKARSVTVEDGALVVRATRG